jgi:hypothetical protein
VTKRPFHQEKKPNGKIVQTVKSSIWKQKN